ncbi:MAG: hypothetical protein ACR2MP_12925 [Streptosporangiaceae bacterium]
MTARPTATTVSSSRAITRRLRRWRRLACSMTALTSGAASAAGTRSLVFNVGS